MAIGRKLALAFGGALLVASSPSALPTTSPQPLYAAAADTLIEKGRQAQTKENYYEALTAFESALVADPGSVEALVAIGETHESLGKRSVGLSYYRRALTLDPNNLNALKRESLALISGGEIEGAENNLDRLRRICGETECGALADVQQAIAAYKAEQASVASVDSKPEPDSGGS